jgi:hypothetical protein
MGNSMYKIEERSLDLQSARMRGCSSLSLLLLSAQFLACEGTESAQAPLLDVGGVYTYTSIQVQDPSIVGEQCNFQFPDRPMEMLVLHSPGSNEIRVSRNKGEPVKGFVNSDGSFMMRDESDSELIYFETTIQGRFTEEGFVASELYRLRSCIDAYEWKGVKEGSRNAVPGRIEVVKEQ